MPFLAGVVFHIYTEQGEWQMLIACFLIVGLEGLYIHWSYQLYVLKKEQGRGN